MTHVPIGNLKTFPLRVVLSVTTDRLLTESKGDRDNGIGDLYDILNHMTGDNLFTHQLPRASRECKPWLYRWYPELGKADARLDSLDDWLKKSPTCPDEGVNLWLTELRMLAPDIRDEYEIGQIPADDHESINPYDEMVQMRGTDEGIVVIDGDGNVST